MSFREDVRQVKNCSTTGIGFAAAAIGVGVGALIYYFFSKRTGNSHDGGSTTSWECEQSQAFRERRWTLEDCSVCFELILKSQDVMSLPCTHHFHTACIMPWLQEKQTCPNCRMVAE